MQRESQSSLKIDGELARRFVTDKSEKRVSPHSAEMASGLTDLLRGVSACRGAGGKVCVSRASRRFCRWQVLQHATHSHVRHPYFCGDKGVFVETFTATSTQVFTLGFLATILMHSICNPRPTRLCMLLHLTTCSFHAS